MATTDFIDGVTLSASSWADDVDTATYSYLTAVAGTNTITATGPTNMGYAAGQMFRLLPAATNTGATTLNITPTGSAALGAKSIFWNGAACVGGELRINVPVAVIYDGTQFHIVANGFNAPFLDTHEVVQGSADSTKKLRFEVDGFTTATTRVLTPPDASGTLATLDAVQALTNKTYNGLTLTSTTGTLTLTALKTLAVTNTLTLSGTDGTTMTFPSASGTVGYLNLQQNSQSAAYTTVLADSGKHILHPTADNNARTFTIDSNANVAYPIGTAITFVNQINTVTIAITADTMTLAGAGTTGSRTLAASGIATALKIASTSWIISGIGLS